MIGGGFLKLIWLKENKGLGEALKKAVEECSNELIARMDSDDISESDRFEKQIYFMMIHEDISIVGGQIEEFIDIDGTTAGKRMVPCTDKEIKKYLKKRCPFNHMTVMFRKADILAAGNYRHWMWNEDYDLWIRLAEKEFLFANLPDILTYVRVGKEMYRRRGGVNYFRSEARIQKSLLDKKIIGLSRYGINLSERLLVQVLMPNFLRKMAYRIFARTKGTKESR